MLYAFNLKKIIEPNANSASVLAPLPFRQDKTNFYCSRADNFPDCGLMGKSVNADCGEAGRLREILLRATSFPQKRQQP